MAASPDAGGARYALCGALRALLRVVILGALVVVGWLLGAGLSHADDDPGLPGAGLISAVNARSADGPSTAGFGVGVPHAAGSFVEKALSTAAAPRLAVQPAEKVSILRPVVHAVGSAKPLIDVLAPLPRPLSSPAPHSTVVRSAAPADKVVPVPPAAPTIAPAAGAPAVTTAIPTPVRHVTPTAVLCSPAVSAARPVPAQPPLRDGPVNPAPESPPGSTSSPCILGSASSGASTKTAPDFAVHESGATSNLRQPDGSLRFGGSDLPQSLAVQPSTSPD